MREVRLLRLRWQHLRMNTYHRSFGSSRLSWVSPGRILYAMVDRLRRVEDGGIDGVEQDVWEEQADQERR